MNRLTNSEIKAWSQGSFYDSHRKLGAHVTAAGTHFCVWVPYVESVSVVGEFNAWNPDAHPLVSVGRGASRFWEGFIPEAKPGHHYKYHIRTREAEFAKADPYGFAMEPPEPGGSALHGLSSIVVDPSFEWTDDAWMQKRADREGEASRDRPVSIYEVHIGSWRRHGNGRIYSYREICEPLIEYVHEMGFTHVEFLPVLEHPFYASWGYQVVGYFAPTHRYGMPADLKYLINELHRAEIDVYLDWVPAHFATDPQALAWFNGKPLYEYADPLMQSHPDWGTNVFDYANPRVCNFLISNALYWLEEYHVDGLRFDAVASMLYRDYSRDRFSPNKWGGRENIEACEFLRRVNSVVRDRVPGTAMIAEESTAWPSVSGPTKAGGLGFTYKWNMGWMHDTLAFVGKSPIYRQHHFKDLTFPLVYAFSEHYVLPLSHDEVVHAKGSLWNKMPGFPSRKTCNLRLLLAHQFGHPGKKLLFMGGEFGQVAEWNHDAELEWWRLEDPLHKGIQRWVRALNALYGSHPALWNDGPGGFEWIDCSDVENGVASYLRRSGDDELVFVFNFSIRTHERYRVGLPRGGRWRVLLNSQAKAFHGSGRGSKATLRSSKTGWQWLPNSVVLALPALGVLVLAPDRGEAV